MWWWQDTVRSEHGDIQVGFTDNRGGVSQGSWQSLNLGRHVGDQPDHVERNRDRLAEGVGVDRDHLVFMNQVHGADIDVVHGPRTGEPTPADATLTEVAGLALVVMVADCTPVLLFDPPTGIIAAVHAGRPGMQAGIVPKTVEAMRAGGATDVHAIVGPSVCGRCYEVPEAMRAAAAAVRPESATVSWTGTPAIDVAAGVVAQLAACGVPLTWVNGCTREQDRLFSYRGDKQAGRFGGVIVRRPTGVGNE